MNISRGEDIHPAEIESLVGVLPSVADCAVIGIPDGRWSEIRMLAIVPRGGQAPDPAGLRETFESRVARFKHPS